MDKIIAACLDDEQHCIDTLKWELSRHCPDVVLKYTFTNANEAKDELERLEIDVLFLDIHLQTTNGIEFLKSIQPIDFKVIFATAFDNYAIQAFELNAQNYLLKPIAGQKLKTAIKRVRTELEASIDSKTLESISRELKEEIRRIKKIPFAVQSGIEFIDPQSILYVEGDNNYSILKLNNGSKLVVSKTLSFTEKALKEYSFLRIHKSFLINLTYLKRYSKNEGSYVELTDGTELRVSRAKRTVLNELFRE